MKNKDFWTFFYSQDPKSVFKKSEIFFIENNFYYVKKIYEHNIFLIFKDYNNKIYTISKSSSLSISIEYLLNIIKGHKHNDFYNSLKKCKLYFD